MSPRNQNYERLGCPTRVILTWKIHPIRRDTFNAQLGSAHNLTISSTRSLLLGLLSRSLSSDSSRAHCASRVARRAAPRRERTRWIYTCTRDIIAASSRHAALVRSGSPRALLPSSYGRRRERKKRDGSSQEERHKYFKLISAKSSTAKIVERTRSTISHHGLITRRSIATFYAMTLSERKEKTRREKFLPVEHPASIFASATRS